VRFTKFQITLLTVFLVGILAQLIPLVQAATISKGTTFSSGTTISSSQVNGNFDQLFTEINSKETRITTLESNFPQSATFFMDEATTTGSALATTTHGSQPYNFYVTNFAGALNGDGFQCHVFIKAGSYNLYALGVKAPTVGKIDWYLDGVLVAAGQDWYDAGLTFNVTLSIPITISTSGDHTISAVVNGKNAASTAFVFGFTKIWIK
jgi:hypothetical protein